MTIKIAFVGAGYICKIHACAAQNTPDVRLEAVVDTQPEVRDEFARTFSIPRQYSSLDELLKDDRVDAVVIGTPNYLHAPMAIAAMKAGVHVMVEKPMAMNAAEGEGMKRVSQETGSLLMVAHCWRFDDEVRWLQDQLAAGKLGRVVRTKGYGVHVHWGPPGWFAQKSTAGGGALADMGIHALDTARFLVGDPQPESVYARIGAFYKDTDVDDTGLIVVNWDNGVTSYVESGWWQPHVDGPEASTQLYGTVGFGQTFPTFLELPDVEHTKIERVESGFPAVRDPHCSQSMYDRQLAYFASCIQEKRPPVPGADEGLVNMRIVDAAYESARSGEVVHLSPL